VFVGAGLRDDRSKAEIVGKTRPYRFNTSNCDFAVFVGAGLRDDRSKAEIVGKTRPYRFNTSNSGLPCS
jgi:hypothetical protein